MMLGIRECQCFVLWSVLLLPSLVEASDIEQIRIEPSADQIEVGEPLYMTIHVEYSKPPSGWTRREIRTGAPAKTSRVDLLLEISHDGKNNVVDPWGLSSGFTLSRRETNGGNQYVGTLTLYYDYTHYKRVLPDPPEEALCFHEPGEHELRIYIRDVASNAVVLEVTPSSVETKKAIALLDAPIDFGSLCSPEIIKDPRSKERLQAIVDQCSSSILAAYASAKLGIIRFDEIMREHNTKGKELYRECYEGLKRGMELPAGAPLRKAALFTLIKAEALASDDKEALKHIDAFINEYPHDQDARKIEKMKAEIDAPERD